MDVRLCGQQSISNKTQSLSVAPFLKFKGVCVFYPREGKKLLINIVKFRPERIKLIAVDRRTGEEN